MKAKGILDLQVKAMVESIARDRDERIAEIERSGGARARELLRRARRASRVKLTEAIREERARLDRRLQREEAGLATIAREHRLRRQRERIRRGRGMVEEALVERWSAPETRKSWIETAFEAAKVLEPGTWQIDYPDGMPAENVAAIKRIARELSREVPELRQQAGLRAGIRIVAKGATLDTTVGGLLSDPERVDGLLLACIMELEESDREGR